MELNPSAFSFYRADAIRSFVQKAQLDERDLSFRPEAPRSLQKTSLSGSAASPSDYVANLTQRLDKLLSFFDSVKEKSPVLNETSAIIIERSHNETSRFSYSSTRDENGVITEEFTFQVRYRPSGETQFAQGSTDLFPRIFDQARIPAHFQRIPENIESIASDGNKSPVEAATAPVSDDATLGEEIVTEATDFANRVTENVRAAASNAAEINQLDSLFERLAGESRAFIERVQQLIEYYRLDSADPAEAPTTGAEAETNAEEIALGAVIEEETPTGVNGLDEAAAASEVLADVIELNEQFVSRITASEGDDNLGIVADYARRVQTGAGDDTLSIVADGVTRVETGDGDDKASIDADHVARISTGEGDDQVEISADIARRIDTGAGDDELSISADTIRRVETGDGDDTLTLAADTIRRVDAGAGDDTITLDAKDAVIGFGAGGGEDVINVGKVGALGVKIDSELATSLDDIEITVNDDQIVLSFKSGESLTINDRNNASLISVIVGGEKTILQVGDTVRTLDAVA